MYVTLFQNAGNLAHSKGGATLNKTGPIQSQKHPRIHIQYSIQKHLCIKNVGYLAHSKTGPIQSQKHPRILCIKFTVFKNTDDRTH